MVTIHDVRAVNIYYQAGGSMSAMREAVEIAPFFDNDPLVALLIVMAEGYAISVGNNLPENKRRRARIDWNISKGTSMAHHLRDKYGDINPLKETTYD